MLEDAYLPILQKYIGSAQARSKSGKSSIYQTPEAVAAVVLEVAQSENPPIRTRTSEWSNAFTHLKTVGDPDGTKLVKEVIEKTMN